VAGKEVWSGGFYRQSVKCKMPQWHAIAAFREQRQAQHVYEACITCDSGF
jgi:hypothetical protein